jgi:hypothetical protein
MIDQYAIYGLADPRRYEYGCFGEYPPVIVDAKTNPRRIYPSNASRRDKRPIAADWPNDYGWGRCKCNNPVGVV